MPYCSQCGRRLPEGQVLCSDCAARMGLQPVPKKKARLGKGIFALVGLLVVLLCACLYAFGKSTPSTSVEPTRTPSGYPAPTMTLASVNTPTNTLVETSGYTPTAGPTAKPTAQPTARPTAKPTARPTAKPTPRPALELVENHSTADEYSRYIEGTVKNNSNKTYSYVQIEFNLYDKDGAQVGTAVDIISNLEAGGLWHFKALIFEDSCKTYKFVDLTGF